MSAISALKGYRTQFLYSLFYMLSNSEKGYSFRLEGEEDLDVLDDQGQILLAIQVKNLSKTLTLPDLLSYQKTSFLKRFLTIYPQSTPVLVSFGKVSDDLKKWNSNVKIRDAKESALFIKSGISEAKIAWVKERVRFVEVNEDLLTEQILDLLKVHKAIDPIPTAENLLYYIQYAAEKQQLISSRDLFDVIDKMGTYLSERIAYAYQYGIFIKPLIKNELSAIEKDKLGEEFYLGVSARYEHVYSGLDVVRDYFLESIEQGFSMHNVQIIHGASGQGKSTLAYRYICDHASQSLIYEISLQDDPVKTNEAIVAIAALTKGLKIPVFFVLHVTPNSTAWLKIAREFANYPFLRLLVTIRNEDWFRAQSAEIDFLYQDVELVLSEEEAEVIFTRMDNRKLIKTHVDFRDVWIELKMGVPLMEFIYAITQGNSLRNKLKSQLARVSKEESAQLIGQLDFLRVLSLADAFGARVDVECIKDIPNVKLIIDKFEKEYLLKHSSDRKFLSGLHPVRSALLVELLFDEFVVCEKDYVLPCLKVIGLEDTYPFLLQALYRDVITSDELIADVKIAGRSSWILYGAAVKSLLWSGIRKYIDQNIGLLDEIYEKSGDAWSIVTDIYHGDVLDLEEVLSSLPSDNEDLVDYFKYVQRRLSPKSDVYLQVVKLFNEVEFPAGPKKELEWTGFAESLFWLSQTENDAAPLSMFSLKYFREAFLMLDAHQLSGLMLGMHYYSEAFNKIRLELAPIFNDKIRKHYSIPLLQVDEDVSFDFVIDMTEEQPSGGWHRRALEIIDLLRDAYPEKAAFRSQGHGHRLEMMPLLHDESAKQIPAKNLPLAKWVVINANLRRLIDFPRRPENWFDFHQRLEAWEQEMKKTLINFRNAFASFKKLNSFTELVPVVRQMNYQSLTRIAAPKVTVDPLGIPVSAGPAPDGENISGQDNKEVYLSKKYKPFFDSYYNYKSSIENFIRQSGQACYDAVKSKSDAEYALNENNLRVSFVNLYDAARHRYKFEQQRELFFKKFSGKSAIITDSDLFGAATIWKSFWAAMNGNNQSRLVLTEAITGLKNDFVNQLVKSIKNAGRTIGFKIIYRNDASTDHLPVFITQVEHPLQNFLAIGYCYNMIYDCVNHAEKTGLKYMMLQRFFSEIYIVGEIRGYVLDFNWMEFPLDLFLNTRFQELPQYRFIPKDIDPAIVKKLKLKSWLSIFPGLKVVQELAADFTKLRLHIGHAADLKYFDHHEKVDDLGSRMVKTYLQDLGDRTTEIWNQLLARLSHLAEEFPEDLTEMTFEDEQEYWGLLLEIMKEIIPETTDGGQVSFNMASLESWSLKFSQLNERWGIFILLLQSKLLLSNHNF